MTADLGLEYDDPMQHAVMNEDVTALCKALFDITLYPTQEKIVRDIAFQKEKNIVINAYTRYGKTFAVGIGVALYLILNKELSDYRIGIVAPTDGDAQNLRREMLKAGIKSTRFQSMLDTSRGNDPEDLVKSRSQDKLTFNDGSIELHNVSASSGKSGDGSGAMGEGFDLVIMDESNRIPYSFWKQSGDRLREHEDSVLIEMGNPFHKDNQFYQHWNRPDFQKYHVDDEKGVKEGRHTREWFDNRAKEIGGKNSLEYQVLYKSSFPDQIESALIAHSWLERAEKNSFEFEDPEIIYSADIAGEGTDRIVLTRLEKEDGKYRLTDQWGRAKSSDTGETAHWISRQVPETSGDVDRMIVDSVGIGAGVHSKLGELGFDPVKFKAGEKPVAEQDRFQNKKARNFFKLRDVLQENDLQLCEDYAHESGNRLIHELTHITTERRNRDKVKVVDPDSGSPDYADSLMMGMYEGSEAWIL